MEFRCADVSPVAVNNGSTHGSAALGLACSNNGSCIKNELGGSDFCSCPQDWQGDVAGFAHFHNCTLHKDYLRVFFVIYSCICLPLIVVEVILVYRIRGSFKKQPRKRGKTLCMLFWHIANWVHVLAVYLQNGFFEGAIVSLCVYLTLGYVMAAQTVNTFVEPLALIGRFKHPLRQAQRSFWYLFIGAAVITNILTLASLGYCRDVDPAIYNALIFSMIAESVAAIAVTQAVLILTTRKVYRLISLPSTEHPSSNNNGAVQSVLSKHTSSHSNASSKIMWMQTKLKRQLRGIMVLAIIFLHGNALALAVICVWAVYGSFPYLYIAWSIQFALGLATFPLILSIISKSLPERAEKSDEMQGVETMTPHSVERGGTETIIILPSSPSSAMTKKMIRVSKSLIGSRRNKQHRNGQLSKIVEEGLSQVEPKD